MSQNPTLTTAATLRGTLSFVAAAEMCNIDGEGRPVLHAGSTLPASTALAVQIAKPHQPTKEIHLFLGENQRTTKNLFLGQFPVEQIPGLHASLTQIKIRLSVSPAELVTISAVGPDETADRTLGVVDISAVPIPPVVPQPPAFTMQALLSVFVGPDFDKSPLPRPGKDILVAVKLDESSARSGTTKSLQAPSYKPCEACAASGFEPNHPPGTCPTCGGTGVQRRMRTTDMGAMISACPCPECDGTGQPKASRCHACNGHGSTRTSAPLLATIPHGVHTGVVVCLLGHGQPGIHGGRDGHLYIRLEVEPAG